MRGPNRAVPIGCFLGCPRSTVEKGSQSNESCERERPALETVPFQPYLGPWVHRKLPQSTVKPVLPSNESYERKTGCDRTPKTVLWVPQILSVDDLPGFQTALQSSGSPKSTAYMLRNLTQRMLDASPQSICHAEWKPQLEQQMICNFQIRILAVLD